MNVREVNVNFSFHFVQIVGRLAKTRQATVKRAAGSHPQRHGSPPFTGGNREKARGKAKFILPREHRGRSRGKGKLANSVIIGIFYRAAAARARELFDAGGLTGGCHAKDGSPGEPKSETERNGTKQKRKETKLKLIIGYNLPLSCGILLGLVTVSPPSPFALPPRFSVWFKRMRSTGQNVSKLNSSTSSSNRDPRYVSGVCSGAFCFVSDPSSRESVSWFFD